MPVHPSFLALRASWVLALDADGYAANTVISYTRALNSFAGWLGQQHPSVGPDEVGRDHIRGWIVAVRDATSSGTARSHFPAVRHFFRWAVAEQVIDRDPTDGLRTPKPNETRTPTLKPAQIRALLATCTGPDRFVARRDAAIIYLFVDGGLRVAELAGLNMDSPDLHGRLVFVDGKGSNRSGPRRRAASLGVKATQALDRYLRERARHPFADRPQLWLGARGRPTLGADGVDAMLKRRAAAAGIVGLHPHALRHTWASAFRANGGQEGDLMVLGGWRSRQMLDRYGKVEADERAREAARRLSFGDRI
jgi:site-specific recombinase XerD